MSSDPATFSPAMRNCSRLMARRRASSANALRLRGPATLSRSPHQILRQAQVDRDPLGLRPRLGGPVDSSSAYSHAHSIAQTSCASQVSEPVASVTSGSPTVLGCPARREGCERCAALRTCGWLLRRTAKPTACTRVGAGTVAIPRKDPSPSRRAGGDEMTRRPTWLSAAAVGGAIALMAVSAAPVFARQSPEPPPEGGYTMSSELRWRSRLRSRHLQRSAL